MSSILEEHFKMVEKVARFVAFDFPDVSKEDLEQNLWVWILENATLDLHNPGVHKILTRVAKSMAWDARKEQLYMTAQYSYRPSDVREILETVFEYEDWARSFCPADANDHDGMGPTEVRMDVSWAFKQLPRNYKTAIETRYRDKVEYHADSPERRRLNRAIKRLTDILNSYYRSSSIKGGPGSRSSITNAHARQIIEDQDDK